ncbi:conserved hypothetical protein [Methylobacterium sp. 4-46]|uniref:hypothetical protein n=1 Tax=unclassified Methylobacterium TaxID=2615210 RepID=UPI000152CC8C|nr:MULTISPECIES: hypothetical protein [Methylobacterium]ACA15481.1 conserved hypothetical protein [Methylobacterium sp. 4-46]WFT81199.1 hypothetical protein QA634_04650 [Methylobacterium nodulans]
MEPEAVEGAVERGAGFSVAPGTGKRPGVLVAMPFDRDLIARFRETFPTAKFRRATRRWFVPGTTAERRVDAWIGREMSARDAHGDAKGRDAYAFEPLVSRYLDPSPEGLIVRTPYSRTVVETLRGISAAHWDPAVRAWRVPWRAYEALKAVWPVIEEAAARNEPEAKRARREAARDPAAERERRRQRHPVPMDDLPPLGVPVETAAYGVVVFEALDAEPIAREDLPHAVAPLPKGRAFVWGWWRMPDFRELAEVLSAARPDDVRRGWWPPTREGLEMRRRRLREAERARATRAARREEAEVPAGEDAQE